MRLRTFTATDMPGAMKLVRRELGEHAVILTSELLKNGQGVTVTAAMEESDPFSSPDVAPSPSIKPPSNSPLWGEELTRVEELRFELQNLLRFHNVPELFVAKMMQKAPDKELAAIYALHRMSVYRDDKQAVRLALEKLLGGFFAFDPLPIDKQPMRVMLAGPPGIGKTVTIAKMAARLTMNKQPVTVITTDNKRAGGVEQLQAFTSILGLNLQVTNTAAELRKTLGAIPKQTQVLIDTAGCNPFDKGDVKELTALATLEGVEPVLVLPAGGDSLDAIDMIENLSRLLARRLLLTRTDTARRFGGVLAAAAATGLSFCNVSNSSSIIDPIAPMNPTFLAQLLLRYQSPYQLQTQST